MNLTLDFIKNLRWNDVPPDVQHMASRCLLDLCGTLVAGRATHLSEIIHAIAASCYGGDEATLLLNGRRVSAPGAALANGMTIDAMDTHDGYRAAKGHAGVNVFPAALAMGEMRGWNGQEFLAALVVGYEVALRAAIALHRTACDYHTSGAWGGLGAAAVASRAMGLNREQTRHALGIAEYHGPRSQMMRCIDHPTMLKDGSGWGSMNGVMAGFLAVEGFTGAPALTVEDESVADIWSDIGQKWLMSDLYFKSYACCRWAQPAVEGVSAIVAQNDLNLDNISRIEVSTFAAATRLTIARPVNTEQAQYSLPYPVAATLFYGQLDPIHTLPPIITEDRILRLAERVQMTVDDTLNQRFPNEALARVTVYMLDGCVFESGVCGARGEPSNPLSDDEITAKFFRLAGNHLSRKRVEALYRACWNCWEVDHINQLVVLLKAPLDEPQSAGE